MKQIISGKNNHWLKINEGDKMFSCSCRERNFLKILKSSLLVPCPKWLFPLIISIQLCLARWRRERISNKTLALAVETEIYNYAKSNLAIINIFIKEPYSKRFRKTEKMSRIAYIASSGGLLGLCMGFSFVSLAEILYHCFICVSIFFKKSSKSTHMMKDLYVTRNSSGNIRK